MCRLSWNLGASASWKPHSLSRSVTGITLPLHYTCVYAYVCVCVCAHLPLLALKRVILETVNCCQLNMSPIPFLPFYPSHPPSLPSILPPSSLPPHFFFSSFFSFLCSCGWSKFPQTCLCNCHIHSSQFLNHPPQLLSFTLYMRQYVPPEHSEHTFTTHCKLLQENHNLFWKLMLTHSRFSCWVPCD